MYFSECGAFFIDMKEHFVSTLERVAKLLIDARAELESIEVHNRELNELHNEITRAHAVCSKIIDDNRRAEKPGDTSSANAAFA
jgi:hypothetical protein